MDISKNKVLAEGLLVSAVTAERDLLVDVLSKRKQMRGAKSWWCYKCAENKKIGSINIDNYGLQKKESLTYKPPHYIFHAIIA